MLTTITNVTRSLYFCLNFTSTVGAGSGYIETYKVVLQNACKSFA